VSVILSAGEGARDLKVNAWNWGVLHHVVERHGLFPAEVWEIARYNAGAELDASQAVALADFLERDVLPRIPAGSRMFFTGDVTDVPDDGTFYRKEDELWRNYSLTHEVLASVIAFLRAAVGPVVVY
jgi:hypothetical protein